MCGAFNIMNRVAPVPNLGLREVRTQLIQEGCTLSLVRRDLAS